MSLIPIQLMASSTNGMASAAVDILSSNKYFLGSMILMMNIGSRYISAELSELQNRIFSHSIARRIFIFIIVWMGTRDIFVALIITTCFILLIGNLFNENSSLCILPSVKQNLKGLGNNISNEDYLLAKNIVLKYEMNKK